MCGIVGAVTNEKFGFTYKETDMIQDMLYADTMRGLDSTGVFSVAHNGNVHLLKDATPGFKFLGTQAWRDFKSELGRNGKFFVGHNRAATRGSVTDKNAHPFCIDDKIVLVQNGTYKGSHHHIKNTDVDTEAIAHLIANEPDIEKALQQVNAAYALVWYNVESSTLHMIRNDERPLFLGELKNGGFVFASEPGIIQFAAGRHDVELKKQPYLYEKNTLGSIMLNEDKSFTEAYRVVDAGYKHPPPKSPGVFPPMVSEDDDGWDGEVAAWWARREEETNRRHGFHERSPMPPALPMPRTNQDKSWKKYNPMEVIQQMNKKPTFTRAELLDMERELKRGTEVVVEPLEYFQFNDSQECNAFYIVCQQVHATPRDKEPYLVFSVYDTNEQEVYDKWFSHLYRAEVTYPTSALVNYKLQDGEYYLGFLIDKVVEIPNTAKEIVQ